MLLTPAFVDLLLVKTNFSSSLSVSIVREPIFVGFNLLCEIHARIVHLLTPPNRLAASSIENKSSNPTSRLPKPVFLRFHTHCA